MKKEPSKDMTTTNQIERIAKALERIADRLEKPSLAEIKRREEATQKAY